MVSLFSERVLYLEAHVPVFWPIWVIRHISINSTVEADGDTVLPIQCFVSVDALGIILDDKSLAIGEADVEMVSVLVIMQKVAFGGFYHNRTGMVLGPATKTRLIIFFSVRPRSNQTYLRLPITSTNLAKICNSS